MSTSTEPQSNKRKAPELNDPARKDDEEEVDDGKDIDLNLLLAEQQLDPEQEKYGKAAKLKGLGWNKFTGLEAIYNGLSKVTKGDWSHSTVHIVATDYDFTLYIQDGSCDLDKFRGRENADWKFISVTGEIIYKFAFVFYRPDGDDISELDTTSACKHVRDAYPLFKDFVTSFPGYSKKFVSVNISHPDKTAIFNLMETIRAKEATGAGRIPAHHLQGDPMRCTFFTTDPKYKQYVVGKISKDPKFRANHEKSFFKVFNKFRMISYAPKLSMIQRVPTLYYHAWLDQQGFDGFTAFCNSSQITYKGAKGDEKMTIRPFEKKAYENKSGQSDKKAAFGSDYFRYGASQRD